MGFYFIFVNDYNVGDDYSSEVVDLVGVIQKLYYKKTKDKIGLELE